MKTLLKSIFTFILILSITQSFSQINLANSTPVVENFNSMSNLTSNALSTSWRIQRSSTPSFSSGTRSVNQQSSSGSPTTGGTYNFGSTSTERCPGAMSSTSVTGPFSLMGMYTNTNTKSITSITVSYTLERYRIQSTSASVQFFYSANGSTWTALTFGDIPTTALPTGSSAYSFNPTGNPNSTNCGVVQKSAFSISSLNIPQNSSIYLRWQITVGAANGSNSQAIGIDDISVTATYPSPVIIGSVTTQPFTTTYGIASSIQIFSISGTNLNSNIVATAPTGFEVSSDGNNYSNTATFNQSSGSASGTLRVRLSSTANVSGNYNNVNIVLSSTGASNVNITTPTSGNFVSKANQTIVFDDLPYKSTYDLDFEPGGYSSSGLPVSYTSSNSNVATIVNGKIHIVGVGTTTITASQNGDGNFNPAVGISKDLMIDDPVSRWSFETLNFSGTGQTPTVSNSQADLGEQTTNTSISGFHNSASTVWSSLVGNGSTKSIASTHWTVGDYFQFQVNTQYTTIIKLTFDQTSSSTGPKNFKLQWSTNGINFTDISNYSVPFDNTNNTAYTWSSTSNQSESSISFDLTGITEINDQPTVYFRVTNTSTSALLGGTIQTAGTSRVDNFTMFGNLDIPLPLNIISFKGKTSGSQNRLEWTLSDWGPVTIQKYVNGVWEVVGHTDNNVWFDTNPYKGISYYRIVSNNTISRPIYIVNEMGFELSKSEFKYYDFGGRNLDKSEKNKVLIKRNEFECEKILILE